MPNPTTITRHPHDDDADVVEFATRYVESAGGARPGTCYTASWNVRNLFGWPIVEGWYGQVPHAWNRAPGNRIFDPTAAQFGHEGPTFFEADDPRFTVA